MPPAREPDNPVVHYPRLSFLTALSLIGATLALMVSVTAWFGPRGWLWHRGNLTHRLLITPTSVVYARGDPWPAGAPPRRTLRQYGFVATHADRLLSRDEIHTYLYAPGSGAKRIVEHITAVSLRNIFLLLLIVPLIHAALSYRHRRAERVKLTTMGKCPGCGYDLRATTGVCPECGAAPPPNPLPRLTNWLVPNPSGFTPSNAAHAPPSPPLPDPPQPPALRAPQRPAQRPRCARSEK
jgi:hypothetical protein